MILTTLEEVDRYVGLHPRFADAVAWMRRIDARGLAVGRHAIDDPWLAAIAAVDQGRGVEGAPLEAHDRHIDLQWVVEGEETMGWAPRAACARPRGPFDAERDIVFFDDAPRTYFQVAPGGLAVFFPEDAHAPLAGTGMVRKVVVKVAVRAGS